MARRPWKASIETKEDLQEIAIYTREMWGISEKNSYLKHLGKMFNRLTENPFIGRKRNETAKVLFSIPSKEHIIFYQFDDEHVYIVRILHHRRDPMRAFS